MGKGHRAMETFSLCIETNFLASRVFTQHLNAATDGVKLKVLNIAAETVCKAYVEVNSSLGV